jgi:single-stranded-DNA-specific exonuclease
VVVTVDCGIRAVDEIEQARRGLEFVVTDHHSVGPALPFASAVINPKREDCPYPFKQLAGVGVAFKLAQALMQEARTCQIPVHVEEESLLDLVAIGTVADLAPLVGENRFLVRRGLEVLNAARREGTRALLRVSKAQRGDVSAATIGYGLGPRINAAGRLGDASLSYDLLLTSDPIEADRLAGRLNERNRQRRDMTAQAYELAEQMALSRGEDVPLLYAADETFMSGIVGLVAGRLTERYYRPSVVVEKGDGLCKGSCRSIDEFHITRALDECRDLLVRHGGHAAAAGFTVRSDLLDELVGRLFEIAQRELGDKELVPTLQIDADVPLAEMSWATADWFAELEPCGERNPLPLFQSRDVFVVHAQPVGSESQHLKLALEAEEGIHEAIAFRMGDRTVQPGDHLDVVYHLEVNKWNGERRLQLNIQDMRATAR